MYLKFNQSDGRMVICFHLFAAMATIAELGTAGMQMDRPVTEAIHPRILIRKALMNPSLKAAPFRRSLIFVQA